MIVKPFPSIAVLLQVTVKFLSYPIVGAGYLGILDDLAFLPTGGMVQKGGVLHKGREIVPTAMRLI